MAHDKVSTIFNVAPVGRDDSTDQQLRQNVARELRFRLMLICGLLTVPLFLIALTYQILTNIRGIHHFDRIIGYVALFFFVGALVYLWKNPGLPLPRLRTFEAALFSSAVFALAVGQYRWFVGDWLPRVADPEVEGPMLELASDSLTLPWFFFIVFYGACIPNTGRRCAFVVLSMAVIAFALLIVLSVDGGEMGPTLFRHSWFKMLFWLTAGVAIAVFGSQRMHRLSRDSAQARKLGRYEIQRKLGEGGMGEVFLAEQPMLRRPCALKIIRPEKAGDPRNLARFLREVKSMASLTGPNAVDIFDYGQAEDGTLYYVMEYLSGLNLQDIVDRFGPLPPERTVYVLVQVCRVLQEAHAIDLIHRDVKPSNVMLCRRGVQCDQAKLLDFGLVSKVHQDEQLTQTGIMTGSPLYISPEQLRGVTPIDARCDLYSLGLVAYVLLTGKHPFKRDGIQAIFAAQLTDLPAPLGQHGADVSPELEVVVMRCLEKEPGMRYESAACLESALLRTGYAGRWTREQAETWWRLHSPLTLRQHCR